MNVLCILFYWITQIWIDWNPTSVHQIYKKIKIYSVALNFELTMNKVSKNKKNGSFVGDLTIQREHFPSEKIERKFALLI